MCGHVKKAFLEKKYFYWALSKCIVKLVMTIDEPQNFLTIFSISKVLNQGLSQNIKSKLEIFELDRLNELLC